MRSTIAAFLMSIPLSAIGLMAIFGIPQMAPGSLFQRDKNEGDEIARGDFLDEEEAPRRRRSRFDQDNAAPAFGEEREDRDAGQAPRFASRSDSDRDAFEDRSRPANGNSDRGFDNENESVNPFGQTEAAPRERITDARTSLTWKAARQKLAELGVSHFHLEQGATPDSFLFVCMFSPGDDPRVTRRFESEAPEPLAAVDGVLNQIDHWMQKRFEGHAQAGLSFSR